MDTSMNITSTMAMIRHSLENVASRDEIMSFIQQLASERDELIRRQEHLASLARLVEKTVSDADDLAAQIKREAKVETETQVKEIMAQAEQNAKQILEEAKSVAAATENEVCAIRENAENTLHSALEEQAARWQEHVKQAADRFYEQMLAQAEESKRRLEEFQGDLGRALASAKATASPASGASAEAVTTATTAAAPATTPAAEAAKERKSVFDAAPDEPAGRKSSAKAEGAAPAKDAKADEEIVDIVILPPRDKQAMENIRQFLERQEEVAAVNVEHMTDRTLIQVLLARPFNVAERLSGLSEVERLQTVKDGAKTKIQVVLSVTSEIERERDRLETRANRIASKIARVTE